jgi:hypothetical protein
MAAFPRLELATNVLTLIVTIVLLVLVAIDFDKSTTAKNSGGSCDYVSRKQIKPTSSSFSGTLFQGMKDSSPWKNIMRK